MSLALVSRYLLAPTIYQSCQHLFNSYMHCKKPPYSWSCGNNIPYLLWPTTIFAPLSPWRFARQMETMFAIQSSAFSGTEARLGRLEYTGQRRRPIRTPHYIGISSRGCVPHITPDMMQSETALSSLYVAFEDCMYRNTGTISAANIFAPAG